MDVLRLLEDEHDQADQQKEQSGKQEQERLPFLTTCLGRSVNQQQE